MKSLQGQFVENTFEVFGFEVLTSEEMNIVRGGGVPASKDKDIFIEDEG